MYCRIDSFAQQKLSIEDCINIAQQNSLDAQQIRNKYLNATYEHSIYRKAYYPSLNISGNLPAFNRSISKIILPNGDEVFVSQSTGNYNGKISINQPIPFLGSNLVVSSGIQRLDLYNDSIITSYLSNVINIGINQSLFKYNSYKWNKKIEPLKLQEAKQEYAEELEDIAKKTIELYFNLLESQTNMNIQIVSKENLDSLLNIIKEKYSIGKCTEDEVMQIEVNLLNAELQISKLKNEIDKNKQILCDFLQLKSKDITLIEPSLFYLPNINIDKVISEINDNSSLAVRQRRKLLEAESNLAKIKSENKPSIDLYATFGLSKSDVYLKETFNHPLNQEVITLSFNIPIYDFGIKKNRIKQAKLNVANINISNEKERLNSNITLIDIVNLTNMLEDNAIVVRKTQELSEKRFNMAKMRYENGKIGFLEYSNALEEMNKSKTNYLNLLSQTWKLYYNLRKLTLYDFKENKKIIMDYE